MKEKELREIFAKVLWKIKPKEAEKKKNAALAKKLITDINKEDYEAVLVGSCARNTFITGDRDLDIFVFFAKNTPRKSLEEKGLALGKKILKKHKPVTHYAEHPYTKAKVNGIQVEIVPCYKIKENEEPISAVDRSPLHNYWVKKNIKKKEDDVLILKQFLKAIECYGADQKVHGFSGVLCEVLIIHYGSFQKLVEVASGWEKKTIIDIKKERKDYKNFPEALVVIDPTDLNRNMAAAVSRTVLTKFILSCREFKKNPNYDSFFPQAKKIDIKKELEGKKIIIATFSYPKGIIEEIVWSQLEKISNAIKKELIDNDFIVYRNMHWTDEKKKCALLFEIKNYTVNNHRKHKGPEVWDAKNCTAFMEKNPKYWIEKSRLYTWKERKYTEATALVKAILESDQVPSHLQNVIKKLKIKKGTEVKHQKLVLRKYFK